MSEPLFPHKDKCSICGHNIPDDYDIPETHCNQLCENRDQFVLRARNQHPCQFCRLINWEHADCPCDILIAYVNEFTVRKGGK